MEFTLIANSGIQLYTCHVDFDFNNSSKQLFHEWFDEEAVEQNLEAVYQLKETLKVVRLSDLEHYGFLDSTGKLKVKEEEVLANPNIKDLYEGNIEEAQGIFSMKLSDNQCLAKKLLNQWLPLPFFELDYLNEFKSGPYNWCRCKIVPKAVTQDNKISADVLLAFDTRTIYTEPDEYAECPSFINDSEKDKKFQLCGNTSHLIDFCSGNNSWVKGYLMNLIYGVSDLEEVKPLNKEPKYSFLASFMLLVEYLAEHANFPDIRLIRDRGVKTTDVEMVIDIGNSRTAAVLFEDGNFTKATHLKLQNFTQPIKEGKLNYTDNSFDMRLAFSKASFGENTLRNSSQFVWPSLIRLGKEAQSLIHRTIDLAEGDEYLSTYSSPKRYLWDTRARREEWRCVPMEKDKRNELPLIAGISKYFSDNGQIDKEGLGSGYHYSRKTLMTFAFMEILSQANMQINSHEYREHNGKVSTPRRLDKVILTCPTAMSKEEQKSLHGSLEDALFVLNRFNNEIDNTTLPMKVHIVPDLSKVGEWMFDEATCSQFVYLYGKFSQTYLNNSNTFFKLYGKKRKNEQGADKDSLIIGSLDMGAGTSDVIICKYEYDERNTSRLKPVPQYWDSFDFAGDNMLQTLISNILLEGEHGIMEQELLRRGVDEKDVRKKLYRFFGADHNELSFKDRIVRRDFNIQVLVPVMYYFLNLMENDVSYRNVSFDDIFKEDKPGEQVLSKFKRHFGFSLEEIQWIYDRTWMERSIENTMDQLLKKVATVMYAYDCDIILLSGRPTSLKPIRNLFLKYFAVSPDRLISLNKHRIGRWYPFADENGYLKDSKSVVSVGAMIGFLSSHTGGLNGLSLDLTELGKLLKPTTNCFMAMDKNEANNDCFITPTKNTGTILANSFPFYIGSKQFDLKIYPCRPFFLLDIDKEEIAIKQKEKYRKQGKELNEQELQYIVKEYCNQLMEKTPLSFTLERDDYPDNPEKLTIGDISDSLGDDVPTFCFSLTVQSLNDPDCYWLDSGAFNININSL